MPVFLKHMAVSFAGALAILSAGAAGAQIISDRFDGVYVGAATLADDASNVVCPPLPLTQLRIKNGILRAYDGERRQIVKGFVTGGGFFNSDYYIYPGGRATPFEGRIDHRGRLVGGVVVGACAWVVELSRSQ